MTVWQIELVPGLETIPVVVDERVGDRAIFVMPMPDRNVMLGLVRVGQGIPPRLMVAGSVRGYGAAMAGNIARAYRPEGLPWLR